MTDTLPVLYILMRTDLDSLNPGKAMAQASHASNAFLYNLPVYPDHANNHGSRTMDAVNEWKNSTSQGFGTVLVLGVDERQMRTAVDVAQHLNYMADVVHDPTYPIVDGKNVHYLPLDTCAWVFCPNKHDPDCLLPTVLGNFSLHP